MLNFLKRKDIKLKVSIIGKIDVILHYICYAWPRLAQCVDYLLRKECF